MERAETATSGASEALILWKDDLRESLTERGAWELRTVVN